MPQFDTLWHGARARLARLKKRHTAQLAGIAKNYGQDSALYQEYASRGPLRDARCAVIPDSFVRYSADNGGVYYADTDYMAHFRVAPDDRPRQRQGIGWYCDEYCDRTATGHAVMLPSRHGAPVYMAYVAFSDHGAGITIDARTCTDPMRAWYAADRLAERIAEEEREYNARQDEAQRIADQDTDDRQEMADCRAQVSKLFAVLRELPPGSSNRTTILDCARATRARFGARLQSIHDRAPRLAELIEAGADI